MPISSQVTFSQPQYWYNMVVADIPKKKEFLSGSSSWTDVRDVTEAHVRALKKDAAGENASLLTAVCAYSFPV